MYLIKDFMTSSIISVDGNSSVEDGAKLMCEKKLSSLLVREDKEYVGIVTKTDFVEKIIAKGLNPKFTKINSVMSKPIFSLDGYIERSEASEFMLRKKIKHLVVTQGKQVVGILTAKDMLS
jgi:signal-transduction protein with cAMP-binding, CBS, and nucleotidyltransferase domain